MVLSPSQKAQVNLDEIPEGERENFRKSINLQRRRLEEVTSYAFARHPPDLPSKVELVLNIVINTMACTVRSGGTGPPSLVMWNAETQ